MWKHEKKKIVLKLLENYQGGEISGANEQLEIFETFYIEKGEFYEKRHRVKSFKDEIVEELVLNYFTILSEKNDWIEDDCKLKAWCNEYGVDDYEDKNAFTDALRRNGWGSVFHYYVIVGDIKLTMKMITN